MSEQPSSPLIRSGGDLPPGHTGPYHPSTEDWILSAQAMAERAAGSSEPQDLVGVNEDYLRTLFEGSQRQ